MNIIIAGGRDFDMISYLQDSVASLLSQFEDEPITLFTGKCDGADTIGEKFMKDWGCKIIPFPANWKKYGKSAGPRRNENMACNADMLIVFWDGISSGSKDMINKAFKYKVETHIFFY